MLSGETLAIHVLGVPAWHWLPLLVLARVLCLLAVLHDVARCEQDPPQGVTPDGLPAEQELEIHAEVFHLLLLRVVHDRLRLLVLLDGDALLIPSNCFRLF